MKKITPQVPRLWGQDTGSQGTGVKIKFYPLWSWLLLLPWPLSIKRENQRLLRWSLPCTVGRPPKKSSPRYRDGEVHEWWRVQDHSPSIPGTKYVKGVGTSQPFSAFLADCNHLCTESNSSNCLTNEQAGGQCGQCWKEVLLKNWTKWRKTLLVIVGFFLINWDDLAEKLEF